MGHSQASANEPRELTFVAEDLFWDEADGFLDGDSVRSRLGQ